MIGSPEVPADPAEAIDQAMQTLFSCCLALCRASRAAEKQSKDELIHAAIEGLDESIRVLRGTATALS